MISRAVYHNILDFSARVLAPVLARLLATPDDGNLKQ